MLLNRRHFIGKSLSLLAGSALLPLLGCEQKITVNAGGAILSGCDDFSGQHYAACVGVDGNLKFLVPVPQRVHGSLADFNTQVAFFFARRPGNQMYLVDMTTGKLLHTVEAEADRHFYGHGAFNATTGLLYTTENNLTDLSGIIGVYRIDIGVGAAHEAVTRVGEFSSQGTGPHQLALLSDQTTLVVANGGLQTHPDSGREVLNLEHMDSSLAYLDVRGGTLLEKFLPQHAKMSIRHLDVSVDDRVVIGVQHQGELTDRVPLLASHRRGEPVQWWSMPEPLQLQIKQYIASIAVDEAGQFAMISCPRGNVVTCWDIGRGSLLGVLPSEDAAGLFRARASTGQDPRWEVTNGTGEIYSLNLQDGQMVRRSTHRLDLRWDNHITLI